VNGAIIDIKNFELFEKAAEGAVISRHISSSLNTKITVESDIINECIKHYEVFYKSLPFPLYLVEDGIKYAALGCFIKECTKGTDKALNMWVDSALYIQIDEGTNLSIKFVGGYWGLVNEAKKQDNTKLDIYKGQVGYTEFNWVVNKIKNREGTQNFYKEIMPDFVGACKGQQIVLQWELSNILNVGAVPKQIILKQNIITNDEYSEQYEIELFKSGQRKIGESDYTLTIGKGKSSIKEIEKLIDVYDFDVYTRKTTGAREQRRNTKDYPKGLDNLFLSLAAIKMANEHKETRPFVGFISGADLVYEIDKRVFTCKAYKNSVTKEAYRDVEIYTYERGYLYLAKREKLSGGMVKETIFSYCINDGVTRLCKVDFYGG